MNVLSKIKKHKNSTLHLSLLIALNQSFVALFFIGIDFLFSKELSIENFGRWKRVIFLINLIIPILSFGISEGYKYYVAKENKNKWMFANTFFIYTLLSFAFLVIVLLLNISDLFQLIDLKEYYLLSILFPLAYFVFVINKTLRYAFINSSQIVLHTKITLYGFLFFGLILLGVFLFFDYFKSYYLYLGIILFILIYLIPIPSLLYKGKFIITFKWMDKSFFIKVLQQGLPLYLATFIGTLTLNTGSLIVNAFEDTKTFAIFSVGAIEIPIFAMLSAAFSQKIYPDLVRLVSNNENDTAKKIWMKTTLQVSYITYPLIILLMFFAKDIVYLIYSPKYEESVFLFKTYLLLGIFRNNYYGALITAAGRTKFITFYAVITLVVNAILSLMLYYIFGISGVVFGTLIATVLINGLQLQKENILKSYLKEFILNPKIIGLISLILLIYFMK
jgi:O-antigen/teichoic acid export membrane protein